MKRLFCFLYFLILVFHLSFAGKTDWWNDFWTSKGMNGDSHIKTYCPSNTKVSFSVTPQRCKQNVSLISIDCNYSFDWYNLSGSSEYRVSPSGSYQVKYIFSSFACRFTLYDENNQIIFEKTEIVDDIEKYYIQVDEKCKCLRDLLLSYNGNIKFEDINITSLSFGNHNLKLVLNVSPYTVDEYTWGYDEYGVHRDLYSANYDIQSFERYVETEKIKISHVEGEDAVNPLDPVSHEHLVYNDPEALLAVNVEGDGDELPKEVDGVPGYLCLAGSIGNHPTGLGTDKHFYLCSEKYPEIKNLKYDSDCSSIVRHPNFLLNSFLDNNTGGVIFRNAFDGIENTFPGGTGSVILSRHLRDFYYCNGEDTIVNDNDELYMTVRAVYAKDYLDGNNYTTLTGYKADTDVLYNLIDCDKQNNLYSRVSKDLTFMVLPKVSFGGVHNDSLYLCPDCASMKTQDMVIDECVYLKGYPLDCTDRSLYLPECRWEYSYDGTVWSDVKDNLSDKLIDARDLKEVPSLGENDLLLHPSVLSHHVMFRQYAILRNFPSKNESSLYAFKEKENLFYIKIVQDSAYYIHYDITPSPKDVKFVEYKPYYDDRYLSSDKEYRLCYGEPFVDKKIAFYVKGLEKVLGTTSIVGEGTATLYRLYGDSLQVRLGDVQPLCYDVSRMSINVFDVPYTTGDTLKLRAVASWCNDSVYADYSILTYPADIIDISSEGMVSPNSFINIRDSVSRILQTVSYDYNDINLTVLKPDLATYSYEIMEDGYDIDWRQFEYDTELFTYLTNRSYLGADTTYHIMRIKNKNTSCYSDNVRIRVLYLDPISNNDISTIYASISDSVYVTAGTGSPMVYSYIVDGGYGIPGPVKRSINLSYVYVWQRLSNGEWKDIHTVTQNARSSLIWEDVSLPSGIIPSVDSIECVRRLVFSRVRNDSLSQIADTSNVVYILPYPGIAEDGVYVLPQVCPGDDAVIYVSESDIERSYMPNIRYVWSTFGGGKDMYCVKGTSEDYAEFPNCDNMLTIKNLTDSMIVRFYRYDTSIAVRSPQYELSLVPAVFTCDYDIYVDGFLRNEKRIDIGQGSRVKLENKSLNADYYVWTLEFQDNYLGDGKIVEGARSSLESPVCYMYNKGLNRIRLYVANLDGCEAIKESDNIYVSGNASSRSGMSSYFEEEGGLDFRKDEKEFINVYPTMATQGETINIVSNYETLTVVMTDTLGRVIINTSYPSSNAAIDTTGIIQGTYTMSVNGRIFRIIIS